MSEQNTNQPEKKKEENKKAETQVQKYTKSQLLVAKAKSVFEKSNSGLDFAREANFAVQILEQNTYLQKMQPESIVNAVQNIALIGLTLNPAMKYAYLVPRNGKCCLDVSYMGMIKLLTDAGTVKNIETDVIYSNDEYDYKKGSNPYIKHKPKLSNRGEMIGAYAIAYFNTGGYQFEIMSKEEIEKIKMTSESYKNESKRQHSPWENWEPEMWKKTVLRRLFKMLPKTKMSEKLIAAVSVEHENEMNDIPEDQKYENYFDDVNEAEVVE